MKKAVFIVLAVMLLAFGVVSNAMAVDGLAQVNSTAVNPGALGSALIYGYYNVRGNIDIFNVVNTNTVNGEKVRVVFRAGKTSEEVLDFAVCLSKTDVWTAFLVDSGTTAEICPFDTDTVTAPTIPSGCQTFVIPSGSSLTNDDLREGYFEVLGFSAIPGYDKNASDANTIAGVTGNYIKTASDCANWNGEFAVASVLMGNNTIVDLTNLATYSYNASAVANWTDSDFGVTDPGPTQEVRLTDFVGCTTIEEMLQKTNVISPYDVMSAIGGETALILTFPTRLECHGSDVGGLFNCVTNDINTGACTSFHTPIVPTVYDDKEVAASTLGFSPAGGNFLTNEVNVIEIGGSSVWNSSLAQSIADNSADGLGWINLGLTNTFFNALTGLDGDNGLPVIAYTTQSFIGGAASYMVPMAYTSGIDPVFSFGE